MRTRGSRLLALACLAAAAAEPLSAGELDIDDLPRSATGFSYYELGRHVPPRSGWANYLGGREVIHPTMRLPLEIDPAKGEHMYCNTQVWGFKDNGQPGGKSNNPINYTFPWTSTFCEQRWTDLQRTRRCGATRPRSHQGSDCRPPKPIADTYWMVAVEDGIVTLARRDLVELVGTSGIKWKYRHGATPPSNIVPRNGRGVPVTKGTRLARVTDLGSTPIHLHLESERPAGSDLDNLPSLVLAYQRALGVGETAVRANGELEFDSRFEIRDGTVIDPCAASEAAESIGTDQIYTFSSLWCHNKSIVGLVETGSQRKFVYYKPNAGLGAAARRDPLLFDGTMEGGRIKGQSLWFNERCGDRRFDAAGEETDANGTRLVTLRGARPSFAGSCDHPAFVDLTMSFSLIRPLVATAGDGGAAGGDVADGTPPTSPPPTPVTTAPAAPPSKEPSQPQIEGPCKATASEASLVTETRFKLQSLWCHERSIVGMANDGAQRKIVYYKPRPDLREAATRDPVLFSGEIAGNGLRGDSVWYSSRCGDRRFAVIGSESRTGSSRIIALKGKRPSYIRGCDRPSFVDVELPFAFLHSLGPDAPAQELEVADGEPHDSPDQPITETSCAAAEREAVLSPSMPLKISSLWCHHGSIMGLVQEADNAQLVYYKPRTAIRSTAGRQALRFEGRSTPAGYAGTGFWTSTRCSPHAFDVTGYQTTIAGTPAIVLQGSRPDIAHDCNSVARIEVRQVYTFLRKESILLDPLDTPVAEPAPEPEPAPADGGGGLSIGFDFDPPDSLAGLQRLSLWSTQYYVFQGGHSPRPDAVPLRDMRANAFSQKLIPQHFCHAAVEGTVRVHADSARSNTFNYAGATGSGQTNCRTWFRPGIADPAARVRWTEISDDAPYGLGNHHNVRLVPYRSIAADQIRTVLKRGTVLFIPRLRGLAFKAGDAPTVEHDGYVYVSDTGGAIRGQHIDFFTGLDVKNPFPDLIRSNAAGRFDAYIVTERAIRDELARLHSRSSGVLAQN